MDATFVAYGSPLVASVVGAEIVLQGQGNMSGAFTPEAILESLEPMRQAAEAAANNRERHRGRGMPFVVSGNATTAR